MTTTNKAKPERVRLVCQECGKRWAVSPRASDPECPRCHGVDYEVASVSWCD